MGSTSRQDALRSPENGKPSDIRTVPRGSVCGGQGLSPTMNSPASVTDRLPRFRPSWPRRLLTWPGRGRDPARSSHPRPRPRPAHAGGADASRNLGLPRRGRAEFSANLLGRSPLSGSHPVEFRVDRLRWSSDRNLADSRQSTHPDPRPVISVDSFLVDCRDLGRPPGSLDRIPRRAVFVGTPRSGRSRTGRIAVSTASDARLKGGSRCESRRDLRLFDFARPDRLPRFPEVEQGNVP